MTEEHWKKLAELRETPDVEPSTEHAANEFWEREADLPAVLAETQPTPANVPPPAFTQGPRPYPGRIRSRWMTGRF